MRKKIILELEDSSGCVYAPNEHYVGMLLFDSDCNYEHFGEVDAARQTEPAQKVFLPDPPPQDDVQALIRLKEAGFTVPEILELRSEHLI